jgi:serine/threonine-protein kinase
MVGAMLRPNRWATLFFFGVCATTARESGAQPSQATAAEKASAEALFDEALRLMHKGAFAEACPKFEMSQRIEAAVGTLLYLAECYEKTGRTASSWATFREAASLAEAAGQSDRMKTARARAARLEPDLAWLTIQVSSEVRAIPGLTLRRATVPVQPDLSGVPVPVDPGDVTVEANAPGYAQYTTSVNVPARGRAVVNVAALTPLPAPAAAATSTSAAPEPSSAPPATPSPQPTPLPAAPPASEERRSVLPYVFGGVGIVGIGLGSYFGLRAISDADDARKACPDGLCSEKRGAAAADDARTAAKISNVSFAVGAGALAAGVVLYFALPSKKTELSLAPHVDQNSAGLVFRGRL